jgi:S1-C subfamily serine protease
VQVSAWSAAADGEKVGVLSPSQIVGSGVIVDSSGYIITNEHVVKNARRVRVMLTPQSVNSKPEQLPSSEPRVLEARLVGANHYTDLALLKVEASGLPTIPIRATSRAHQGQIVLAVAAPEDSTIQ